MGFEPFVYIDILVNRLPGQTPIGLLLGHMANVCPIISIMLTSFLRKDDALRHPGPMIVLTEC